MGDRTYRRVKVTAAPGYPYASVYGVLDVTFPPDAPRSESTSVGASLRLMVDTLATRTTLGPGSTVELGIPLDQLPATTTQTVLGPLEVRVLENVQLHVTPLEGPRLPLTLKKIHLMDPDLLEDENGLSRDELENIPNILGTDILRRGGLQVAWANHRDSYLILKIRGDGEIVHMVDPTDD